MNQFIPDDIESRVTITPDQIPEDTVVIVARHHGKLYMVGSDFRTNTGATITDFRRKVRIMETIALQYQFTKERK